MELTYSYLPCDDYEEFYALVNEYIMDDWFFPVFVEVIFSTTHVYYVVSPYGEVPEVTSIPVEKFESWYSEYSYMPDVDEFVAETFINYLGQSTLLTVIVPEELEGGLPSC